MNTENRTTDTPEEIGAMTEAEAKAALGKNLVILGIGFTLLAFPLGFILLIVSYLIFG